MKLFCHCICNSFLCIYFIFNQYPIINSTYLIFLLKCTIIGITNKERSSTNEHIPSIINTGVAV